MKKPSELVERAQVLNILGIDRQTLGYLEKQADFPRKISFHRPVAGKMKKEYRWNRVEIMEWAELNRVRNRIPIDAGMVQEFFKLMRVR